MYAYLCIHRYIYICMCAKRGAFVLGASLGCPEELPGQRHHALGLEAGVSKSWFLPCGSLEIVGLSRFHIYIAHARVINKGVLLGLVWLVLCLMQGNPSISPKGHLHHFKPRETIVCCYWQGLRGDQG